MLASIASAIISVPLDAQETANDDADESEPASQENQIVVTAQRLRGQLDVEQAPILELNAEDIQASGATSIAELVQGRTHRQLSRIA